MDIRYENIKVFGEGTKTIHKGDINDDIRLVVIPTSVNKIEKYALAINDYVCNYVYLGTEEQLRKIDFEGTYPPCIDCPTGLVIFGL